MWGILTKSRRTAPAKNYDPPFTFTLSRAYTACVEYTLSRTHVTSFTFALERAELASVDFALDAPLAEGWEDWIVFPLTAYCMGSNLRYGQITEPGQKTFPRLGPGSPTVM